ncbi:cytochrome P450 [Pseudofrankia inefficax]|uniref:Cytochrome P450 n=1 Tax=Pseudofrankia inefficax (strain DSM 45817 / CECT 9037 / DDB 130130 / EuI1c) TaxID=298654 RepID=E3IZR3_PSEI1|nr:cytochrome P450 [Pseudofrankia inefficax]ADP83981.1 cytochrome P450 [Pseudofrankia inefficax]
MIEKSAGAQTLIDDEWVEKHFDPVAPELARDLHPTLARARSRCPVARSDQHGGFWVVTRKEDVLRVAQDWQTFTSEEGITVPAPPGPSMKILPVTVDPPLQRAFRQLTNPYFRPAVVSEWEAPTRQLVNRLIDGFIEEGACEFMEAFARPLPGLAFFDLALHAPAEDLEEVNGYATMAGQVHRPEAMDCLMKLAGWIAEFIEKRRREGPRGDVVDAVMGAEIEGRPITPEEVIGTIHLLILGGLETTAGVLGMAMQRMCEHPEILAALRERPELIPNAVEEFLRMDGSFVGIARCARHDTEIGGKAIRQGEQVLMYWASANRDEAEFEDPDVFDLDRSKNPHLAFGAGPHRCAGSNLARMNLRVALDAIVQRLHDVRLQPGADIEFISTFSRAPVAVPITFTPGPRSASS